MPQGQPRSPQPQQQQNSVIGTPVISCACAPPSGRPLHFPFHLSAPFLLPQAVAAFEEQVWPGGGCAVQRGFQGFYLQGAAAEVPAAYPAVPAGTAAHQTHRAGPAVLS